jgi:23S rRNA pseudouridine1911/1915/1917 synthase
MVRPQSFVVPSELTGERLDRALVGLLEGAVTRSRVQELIRDGAVRIDGVPSSRAAQSVEAGQTIEIVAVPRARERSGGPAGAELVLVFEDEHLAVVDKPAGQLAHPTDVVRGGTVSELAVERFGPLPAPQGEDRPGIVHRLDADTSGLLVLARSPAAAEALVTAFRERAVEKRYLALVHGDPRFDSDWISTPIGRASGRSDRMSIQAEGRAAETFYRVLERFGRFALLECQPKTGRTHQIRVHLASIGHPLVGDRIYPGRVRVPLPPDAPEPGRHFLHATGLAFAHPVTGRALAFESAPPADFQAWLEWLRRAP